MQVIRRKSFSGAIVYGLLVVLLCCSTPLLAQQQSVRPGINDHYQNPDFKLWQRRFESAGREVFDMADEIVAALQLKPGMQVADIGAGTGLFSRRFAGKVGASGKVYAIDISKEFIDNIRRQAHQSGLKNIEAMINTDKSILLAANSIELAYVCDTYHHFEYPQAMLASIYQALKKHGRLVVIDFRKDPKISSSWVMDHVRANQQTVRQEIERAGFRYIKDEDILQGNYFMVFEK